MGCRGAGRGRHVRPHLLLTYDFPPIGGGISRMMGEIARRYPPGGLVVSTGSTAGEAEFDAGFPHPVDRMKIASRPGTENWIWKTPKPARASS